MFQRAKSFIIRRKKSTEGDLELPDSSHLVRRPVTASMQDRINVRAIQKNNIQPNMDFDTLRQKSTSLEHVQAENHHRTNLQKTHLVLSSDGIDTIRRKKELQKRNESTKQLSSPSSSKIPVFLRNNNINHNKKKEDEDKVKITKSNSQRNKLFRVSSRRRKNEEQNCEDQRNSFIFVKMEK